MKKLALTTAILVLSISTEVYSQKSKLSNQLKFIETTPWIFEIGSNVIDDDGEGLECYYKLETSSFAVAKFPSRISLAKDLSSGFRIQLSGNLNVYKVGTVINRGENAVEKKVCTVDFNLQYSLNEKIKINKHFDPYFLLGYGYTKRGNLENANNNFGFGTNIYLKNNVGLNFQAIGKWTLKDGATNYVHMSAGIIYKIGNDRRHEENDEEIKAKTHIRDILRCKF